MTVPHIALRGGDACGAAHDEPSRLPAQPRRRFFSLRRAPFALAREVQPS